MKPYSICVKLYILTSINHNADHGFRVPNGAAPQQEVAAVEADSNSTGVLSVKHTHVMRTAGGTLSCVKSSCLQQNTHMKPRNLLRSLLGFSHSIRLWKFSGLNSES